MLEVDLRQLVNALAFMLTLLRDDRSDVVVRFEEQVLARGRRIECCSGEPYPHVTGRLDVVLFVEVWPSWKSSRYTNSSGSALPGDWMRKVVKG